MELVMPNIKEIKQGKQKQPKALPLTHNLDIDRFFVEYNFLDITPVIPTHACTTATKQCTTLT